MPFRSLRYRGARRFRRRPNRPRMKIKLRFKRKVSKYVAPKSYKFIICADDVSNNNILASSGVSAYFDNGGLHVTIPPKGSAAFGVAMDTSYITVGFFHTISDLPQVTAMTQMYDRFRIRGIKSRMIMNQNVNEANVALFSSQTGTIAQAPSVTMLDWVDYADLVQPTATEAEWTKVLSWQRARLQSAVQMRRQISRYYRARQLTAVATVSGSPPTLQAPANAQSERAGWTDGGNGSTVVYPGLRLMLQFVNSTGATCNYTYNWFFDYYVNFTDFTGLF